MYILTECGIITRPIMETADNRITKCTNDIYFYKNEQKWYRGPAYLGNEVRIKSQGEALSDILSCGDMVEIKKLNGDYIRLEIEEVYNGIVKTAYGEINIADIISVLTNEHYLKHAQEIL